MDPAKQFQLWHYYIIKMMWHKLFLNFFVAFVDYNYKNIYISKNQQFA